MNPKTKTRMVAPVPGRHIQDPQTGKLLAPAGELKPMTSYWCRRIQQGDAVLLDGRAKLEAPPAAVAPPKTKSKA